MNLFDSLDHRRKQNAVLQLAPMIDIFVLIIVFLMQSTVIGTTSVIFPDNMSPPQSKSIEDLENSPSVEIFPDRVEFRASNTKIPVEAILNQNERSLDFEREAIRNYLGKAKETKKDDVHHLNVIADRSINYEVIFQVVKFFKAAGFQSVLFVAEGERR